MYENLFPRLTEALEKLSQSDAKIVELSAEVSRLSDYLRTCEEAKKSTRDELDKINKDQDDLLVLLADQVT